MNDPTELALRLSYELAGLQDRDSYLTAMGECLFQLIPAETFGWVGAHTVTQRVEIGGTDGADHPEIVEALARSIPNNPMFLSYAATAGNISPRRMSDLIDLRNWRNHPVYHDLFVPMGVSEQLVVVLSPPRGRNWNAWAFNRVRNDFTDGEVELTTRLQPMLITLNQLSCLAPTLPRTDFDQGGRTHLTQREVEVLQLLAADFTATGIASILRISTLTVRKHLEHMYEKLGVNDRLAAVIEGIRRGIIAAPPSGARGNASRAIAQPHSVGSERLA